MNAAVKASLKEFSCIFIGFNHQKKSLKFLKYGREIELSTVSGPTPVVTRNNIKALPLKP